MNIGAKLQQQQQQQHQQHQKEGMYQLKRKVLQTLVGGFVEEESAVVFIPSLQLGMFHVCDSLTCGKVVGGFMGFYGVIGGFTGL